MLANYFLKVNQILILLHEVAKNGRKVDKSKKLWPENDGLRIVVGGQPRLEGLWLGDSGSSTVVGKLWSKNNIQATEVERTMIDKQFKDVIGQQWFKDYSHTTMVWGL